jgi:hypothetical protein
MRQQANGPFRGIVLAVPLGCLLWAAGILAFTSLGRSSHDAPPPGSGLIAELRHAPGDPA